MTFKQLRVGQQFDFINDSNRMFNSFYHTCKKVSTRKYSYQTPDAEHTICVGSINVEVFHVGQ